MDPARIVQEMTTATNSAVVRIVAARLRLHPAAGQKTND